MTVQKGAEPQILWSHTITLCDRHGFSLIFTFIMLQ